MSIFHVSKLAPELVGPSESTPSVILPLSTFDRMNGCFHIELIQVFRHGHKPVNAIKEALSKALVDYYPIAGRFLEADSDDVLHVECTSHGVWFIEASADCSLQDVEFLENQPIMISKEYLLPSPPPGVDERREIFLMQVTQFKRGGFIVGVKFNHKILDGVGAAQFIRAIGELAKATTITAAEEEERTQPTTKPIWCREGIPDPNPNPNPPTFDLATIRRLQQYVIDISQDQIDRIKHCYFKETGRNCSSFDVIAAKFWQSRIRAIGLKPDVDVTLTSTANIRQLLLPKIPQLKEGYYGNCTYDLGVKVPCNQITQASLVEVVNFVKYAKEDLASKLGKWLNGDLREIRQMFSLNYEHTHLIDWRQLGLKEVDYGWGTPISAFPFSGRGSNYLINLPAPKNGVRLTTWCVVEEHMEAFQNELTNLY